MCVAILVLASMVSACATGGASGITSQEVSSPKELSGTEIAEKFGIEVVALRSTAAGHMLDFRFRVVDLEKAMPFFREDIKPYLVDQASGKSLNVPVPAKLGPMRPTGRNPKLGVTYWMFFGNPGLVEPGDKVTIAIGDYRLTDLVVQGQ